MYKRYGAILFESNCATNGIYLYLCNFYISTFDCVIFYVCVIERELEWMNNITLQINDNMNKYNNNNNNIMIC